MEVFPEATKVQDRIANELAGTMVGHVSAALDFDAVDAGGRQGLGACDDVSIARPPAEGHDGSVLQEQNEIMVQFARDSGARQDSLPGQACTIGNGSSDRHQVNHAVLISSVRCGWVGRARPGPLP